MKILIGVILGGLAAWVYRSERAHRELCRRVASAPQLELTHTEEVAMAS